VLIIGTCFAGRVILKIGRNSKQRHFVLAETDAHGSAIDGPHSLTGVTSLYPRPGCPGLAVPMLSADHLARECARNNP
jgi:hypothetical protein